MTGESSAGHATPTWLWSWEHEAVAAQWRINDGPWWEADPTTGQVTAPEPLGEGVYTVSIELVDDTGLRSEPGIFDTEVHYYARDGYWTGVARELTTSPLGHAIGVVAHNCYEEGLSEPGDNLVASLDRMIDAVEEGADLIEWDVRQDAGQWVLEHDDFGSSDAARVADLLVSPEIATWDQPIYIEIKERDPTPIGTENLLEMLLDAGLAENGRPLIIRAFQDERIDNLHLIRELLDSGDYPLQAPYVRLHVLMDDDTAPNTPAFHALILDTLDSGFDGIEFNWHTPDLFNLVNYARSFGLGVGLWTVPERMGEAWCASLREDIDALVVDYDLGDCREVAEEETQLVYLNTADMIDDLEVAWYGEGEDVYETVLGDAMLPGIINRTVGPGLYGDALLFNASMDNALPLYDADNLPGEGFLLAVTVEFDDVDLARDEVVAIFSKADSGGFALELVGGWFGTYLRFGVHQGSEYSYADVSISGLDLDHAHFIMGTYDGAGRVRLWVNNSDSGVDESAVLSGGVTTNDVPALLGADPQGLTDARYHFTGRIQMAMLQTWRDH